MYSEPLNLAHSSMRVSNEQAISIYPVEIFFAYLSIMKAKHKLILIMVEKN